MKRFIIISLLSNLFLFANAQVSGGEIKRGNFISANQQSPKKDSNVKILAKKRQPTKTTANKSKKRIDKDVYSKALEALADKGDLEAIRSIAYFYLYGKGVKQDINTAMFYFIKGGNKGDKDMQCAAGVIYSDYEMYNDAFQWLTVASNNGSAYAKYRLSILYYNGWGVLKDTSKAHSLLLSSANDGDDDAQALMGHIEATKDTPDYKKALYWLEKAALQENAKAYFDLGCLYLYGLGVTKNSGITISYLKKASENGNSDSMVLLGDLYRNGTDVTKDANAAYNYYLQAAQQNNTSGQSRLGQAYFLGDIIRQDYSEAVKWLSLATNNADPYAEYFLGRCYEDGLGVERNFAKCSDLYLQSAAQGLAVAQSRWGVLISSFSSNGDKRLDPLACCMFRKAARENETRGMLYYGRCLYEGVGIKKDKKLGTAWIFKAADEGDVLAEEYVTKNKLKRNNITNIMLNNDIMTTLEVNNIADTILANVEQPSPMRWIEEPSYRSNVKNVNIIGVGISDYLTTIVFSCTCESPTEWINISRSTYIEGNGKKNSLLWADNIKYAPQYTEFKYVGEEIQFALFFPSVDDNITSFNLIEPGELTWKFYDINLVGK